VTLNPIGCPKVLVLLAFGGGGSLVFMNWGPWVYHILNSLLLNLMSDQSNHGKYTHRQGKKYKGNQNGGVQRIQVLPISDCIQYSTQRPLLVMGTYEYQMDFRDFLYKGS
jgi:hypothetical protein